MKQTNEKSIFGLKFCLIESSPILPQFQYRIFQIVYFDMSKKQPNLIKIYLTKFLVKYKTFRSPVSRESDVNQPNTVLNNNLQKSQGLSRKEAVERLDFFGGLRGLLGLRTEQPPPRGRRREKRAVTSADGGLICRKDLSFLRTLFYPYYLAHHFLPSHFSIK